MRLFIGIPLSTEVQTELEGLVAHISPQVNCWRWSPAESWHITLQFLGNTTPDECAAVVTQLRAICSQPVPVRLCGFDLFDRVGVFAEVAVSPELVALEQKVVDATTHCGFVAESRPYHPHITLARSKGRTRGENLRMLREKILNQGPGSSFVADEFLLYESFPGPEGSRYEVRDRFQLA